MKKRRCLYRGSFATKIKAAPTTATINENPAATIQVVPRIDIDQHETTATTTTGMPDTAKRSAGKFRNELLCCGEAFMPNHLIIYDKSQC